LELSLAIQYIKYNYTERSVFRHHQVLDHRAGLPQYAFILSLSVYSFHSFPSFWYISYTVMHLHSHIVGGMVLYEFTLIN